MKAVILARVSSREQEETGYSLPAQEKLLKDYAARKQFQIVKVFSASESASGAKQRKVFCDMMKFVEKKGIPHLLCEKVDRMTRNLKDAVIVNDWLESNPERQIHFVKQNLIIHKNAKSDEKFRWDIEIVLAKKYISNLSEEVKKGQKEKLAQGWLPQKPPLGYKTIGEKGHKIHVIDDGVAPLIREAFELYATGQRSLKTLGEAMFEKGLRSRSGRMIPKSRLADILNDPFYIRKNRFNGQITPGEQERLISDDLFNNVQEILRRKHNPKYRKHCPVFKGLVVCEGCNGRVTWETQKGHWYGHCNTRNCPSRLYVRQEKFEEQVLPLLDRIAIKNSSLAEVIQRGMRESYMDQVAYRESSLEQIEEHRMRVQKRKDTMYEDRLEGRISLERWQLEDKKADALLAEIDEQRGKIRKAETDYRDLGANVVELARKSRRIYESKKRKPQERHLLFSLVFSSLSLNADRLTPTYSPAFATLEEFAQIWNKKFEPIQNTAISGAVYELEAFDKAIKAKESSEPRKDFRTSKNPRHSVRFSHSAEESGALLRR
ncbi:MAG: Recombinase [Parcubacteria group bacterium GW2011_GWB1_40_14]|nr:MAG: Recombinase [Parcubacteria group bacterium GW2011_GWB1_40_14]